MSNNTTMENDVHDDTDKDMVCMCSFSIGLSLKSTQLSALLEGGASRSRSKWHLPLWVTCTFAPIPSYRTCGRCDSYSEWPC